MLSDALDALALAVLVATTYIGFGIVPAGFALGVALFVASLLFDKSGRPELPRITLRRSTPPARRRIDLDNVLTNGTLDAEIKQG